MGVPNKTFLNNNPPTLDDNDLNALIQEVNRNITSSGQTPSEFDWDQTAKSSANYATVGDYLVDSGAADAYHLDGGGARLTPTGYFEKMQIRFTPLNANTGPSTVQMGALGLKDIYVDGAPLVGGEFAPGVVATITYNGTRFDLTKIVVPYPAGHIDGGVPERISGTELSFSQIKARSDDDTTNMNGGIFSKTLAQPFVTGSGNAGIVAGASNSWKIVTTDSTPTSLTASGTTSPEGILWLLGGAVLLVVDNTGDQIIQYNPTTPYDATTKGAITTTLSVSAQGTAPYDVCATLDALDIYVINDGGNDIDQYTMTTAGDLTTATFTGTFDVGGEEAAGRGLDVDPGATKLILVGQAGDGVDEYTFGTARDITTLSHDGFTDLPELTQPESVRYGDSGSKFFVASSTTDAIHEYKIKGTAYSPTNDGIIHNGSFSVAVQDTDPSGIDFDDVGKRLYVAGNVSNNIFEYNMDTFINSSIHAFGISNQITGVYDVVYDLDPNGANIASDPNVIAGGFDKEKWLGCFRTNDIAEISEFNVYSDDGKYVKIQFSTPKDLGFSYTSIYGQVNLLIPDGRPIKVDFSTGFSWANIGATTRYIYMEDDLITDKAIGQVFPGGAGTRDTASGNYEGITSTSQISLRVSSTANGNDVTTFSNGYSFYR